jgi:hypothetical protein
VLVGGGGSGAGVDRDVAVDGEVGCIGCVCSGVPHCSSMALIAASTTAMAIRR